MQAFFYKAYRMEAMNVVTKQVKSKSRKAPKTAATAATATRRNRPQRMQVDKAPKVHVPHGMSLRARSKKPNTSSMKARKPRVVTNWGNLTAMFNRSIGFPQARQPVLAAPELAEPVILAHANAPLFAPPRFTFAPPAQQAQAAAQTAVQAAQTAVQAAHVAEDAEMEALAQGMARIPKINSKGRRRSPATGMTLYK